MHSNSKIGMLSLNYLSWGSIRGFSTITMLDNDFWHSDLYHQLSPIFMHETLKSSKQKKVSFMYAYFIFSYLFWKLVRKNPSNINKAPIY